MHRPRVSPTAVRAAVRMGRRRRRQAASSRRPRRGSTAPATTRMTACGPAMIDDERAEQREPERERGVEGQREDAVRRQQLAARDDLRDHRRLRRGEEDGHGRDEQVQQQDQQQVVADQDQPDAGDTAQHVRRDQHEPAVDPVDVDPGDRGEQHGRHEERQDQQADGGVRVVLGDDDRQPEEDHVAADLGRGLGQPEAQERRVPEDGERALARTLFGVRLDRRRTPTAPRYRSRRWFARDPCARGRVGRSGDRGRDRRVATLDEAGESTLERRALDQHVPSAGLAAQPDVRAEAVDEPRVAAARMRSSQAHDVAEQQFQDGSVRHGGQGIRGVGDHGSGRVAGPWRGRRPGRAGVTSTITSGCVADSWAMIPPGRVSEPVSLSGAPIALSVNGSSSGVDPSVTAPAAPTRDHARARAGRRRWPSPRHRRCAAR